MIVSKLENKTNTATTYNLFSLCWNKRGLSCRFWKVSLWEDELHPRLWISRLLTWKATLLSLTTLLQLTTVIICDSCVISFVFDTQWNQKTVWILSKKKMNYFLIRHIFWIFKQWRFLVSKLEELARRKEIC